MSHTPVVIEVISLLGAGVILAGIPMAYFGLVLYRIYLAVLGFLVGGIMGFGFGIGAVVGVPITDGGVAALLVIGTAFTGAFAGAGLANALHRLATALIGFVGGVAFGIVFAFLIGGDPNSVGGLPLVFGVGAALLALYIEDWLIAISTATTGAVMIALPLGVMVQNVVLAGVAFLFVGATGVLVQANVLIRSGAWPESAEGEDVPMGPRQEQETLSAVTRAGGNTETAIMGGIGSEDDPYDLEALEERTDDTHGRAERDDEP